MKFYYLLFSFGIVFSSVYLFPSGLPQISDIIFSFFIVSVFFKIIKSKRNIPFPIFFKLFLLLVIWISLVSVVWGLIRQNFSFLLHPLYYIYNFTLCFSIFYILNNYKEPMFFKNSFLISVIFSVLGVLLFPNIGRATGFFNNPNQLAFYSLCMVCIISVLYDFKIPMKPLPIIALFSIVISIFAASSLAGLLGLLIFLLSYIFANITSLANTSKIIFLSFIIFNGFVVVNSATDSFITNTFMTRLDRAESKVDNIYSERKYDRIIEFSQYLYLGAGEGDYERFLPLEGGEIHSTYGNLLFAYGIIGIGMFLIIIFYLLYTVPFHVSLMTIAPLFYSISHMGLRSSFFWILIFFIYYFYVFKKNYLIEKER